MISNSFKKFAWHIILLLFINQNSIKLMSYGIKIQIVHGHWSTLAMYSGSPFCVASHEGLLTFDSFALKQVHTLTHRSDIQAYDPLEAILIKTTINTKEGNWRKHFPCSRIVSISIIKHGHITKNDLQKQCSLHQYITKFFTGRNAKSYTSMSNSRLESWEKRTVLEIVKRPISSYVTGLW